MFDPLNPTPEQQDKMTQGYRDGIGGKVLCQSVDVAYRHGYRVGRNDDTGKVEEFQRELIRRQNNAIIDRYYNKD